MGHWDGVAFGQIMRHQQPPGQTFAGSVASVADAGAGYLPMMHQGVTEQMGRGDRGSAPGLLECRHADPEHCAGLLQDRMQVLAIVPMPARPTCPTSAASPPSR